jgi:hypothetical protein
VCRPFSRVSVCRRSREKGGSVLFIHDRPFVPQFLNASAHVTLQ